MIRILLLLAGLMTGFFVSAGPPPDAQRVMRPYPCICTPTLTSLLTALQTDYAVHVASSFVESPDPDGSYVMIVENPDTLMAGVVHIDGGGRSCLVFSGRQLKKYIRDPNMAPPEVDHQNSDTES